MHLVIVHYHLNPGGVTSVIQGHIRALATLPETEQPESVHVLFDGHRDGWSRSLESEIGTLPVELHPIPELGYDRQMGLRSDAITHRILSVFLDQQLPLNETVVHIHNHGLGKNASLPETVHSLAARGCRILLQIHDFAEDFRPANYHHMANHLGGIEQVPRRLYPQAPQIHYAVLNHRDYAVLERAAVPVNQLHWIPNPIREFVDLPDAGQARRSFLSHFRLDDVHQLLLYPVRAIRRKNLGEAIAWSMAVRDQNSFVAVTLAPRNPVEGPVYQHWMKLTRNIEAPLLFEAGGEDGLGYLVNIAAADWYLSTSVAEGFGMVFLEAWLAQRPLAGRNLSEITSDFEAVGVEFPTMADVFNVPWEWVNRDQQLAKLQQRFDTAVESYGMIDSAPMADAPHLAGDHVDFACLDLAAQTEVIRRLADREACQHLRSLNPIIDQVREGAEAQQPTVAANYQTVVDHFGLRACGLRLYDIYSKLLSEELSPEISFAANADSVLADFLQPQRFHPIRTE